MIPPIYPKYRLLLEEMSKRDMTLGDIQDFLGGNTKESAKVVLQSIRGEIYSLIRGKVTYYSLKNKYK